MTRPLLAGLVAVGILIGASSSCATGGAQVARSAEHAALKTGQDYLVLWGFFTEVLRIDAILADGWVTARAIDPQTGRVVNTVWQVNTRQMLGVTPWIRPGQRAD